MRFLIQLIALTAGLFLFIPAHADELDMLSTDFLDKGVLPVLYTCDGKGISPQVSWVNVPKNAKALALIFSDNNPKDAKDKIVYHWALYNLPPNITEIESNIQKLPAGAAIANNSSGKKNYLSPCPERGNAHQYVFTLYVLDKKIDAPKSDDAKDIVESMKGHILQSDTLTAVYSRWPVPLN